MNLPKSIKSYNIKNKETSYANSVLQSFLYLECVQNWLNSLKTTGQINNNFYNTTLTKDLFSLFNNLSQNINIDSSQLILDFESKSNELWKKNINQDAFHFLNYLLKILHIENNRPKNTNFDHNLYLQNIKSTISNDLSVFSFFNNYLDQTQNSFISVYFYNVIKYCVNCPRCSIMFNYIDKKIIRFNLDEINPNKSINNKKISLNDCFNYFNKVKKEKCKMCQKDISSEFQQIYNSAKLLIIEFNRKKSNSNFKNDVRLYLNFDISRFIINQECENKNYNLKAVVCRYGPNNYFADVKINSNFYRFMDCLKGIDVKKLNNINELSEYEPQLLFYEIEYPNKALITNEEINEQLLSNLSETMSINLNLMNNMSSSSSIHDSLNYVINFTLKFIVRPQIWDQKEESALVINVQVSNDLTLEETINRFFKKLKKPKEAIINFTFKDNQLDENSKQKLEELNINKYSVIYALKNSNFDDLVLQE